MIRIKTLISKIKTTVRFKLCFSKTPRVFGYSIGETVPFKDCGNLKIPKSVAYRHCSTTPKATMVTQNINDLVFGTPGAGKSIDLNTQKYIEKEKGINMMNYSGKQPLTVVASSTILGEKSTIKYLRDDVTQIMYMLIDSHSIERFGYSYSGSESKAISVMYNSDGTVMNYKQFVELYTDYLDEIEVTRKSKLR